MLINWTCTQRIFIAGIALACGSGAWGRTWTVGKAGTPCQNPDFSTIVAAIDAAQAGDTVEICPALYPEQLVISKPLTLTGVLQKGVNRVVIQPANVTPNALGFAATISVEGTAGVTISNMVIDASHNQITACTPALSGIHFHNASGVVDGATVSAQIQGHGCNALFPGNGSGIQIDSDWNSFAPFRVAVRNSSIHDYSRNGILATGSATAGIDVDLSNNSISGMGPAAGVNQFGIILANGVTGQVVGNVLTQRPCGDLGIDPCFDLRSEGVVLRSVGAGVLVSNNLITNTQAGVFVNGAKDARVLNNVISNTDALSGIHIQGSVTGVYQGNRIMGVGPITADASVNEEGCGINDVSGAGNVKNTIMSNWINDAYCGVAYITGDSVANNVTLNTLYETLNGDDYPDAFPPATPPGQPAGTPSTPKVRQNIE